MARCSTSRATWTSRSWASAWSFFASHSRPTRSSSGCATCSTASRPLLPHRPLPIARARGLLHSGTTLHHHPELVGLERAIHGLFLRDEPTLVEREQALVERLHRELFLTDLHLRVDLVNLVLADQVPDRGVRDHDL